MINKARTVGHQAFKSSINTKTSFKDYVKELLQVLPPSLPSCCSWSEAASVCSEANLEDGFANKATELAKQLTSNPLDYQAHVYKMTYSNLDPSTMASNNEQQDIPLE